MNPAPRAFGIFEWRHNNQYVAGPGSSHHSGSVYAYADPDHPIADFPEDWLPKVLAEIAKTAKVHYDKTGKKGEPDRNGYVMLYNAYFDAGEDAKKCSGCYISGGNSAETQKWLDEINAESEATSHRAASGRRTRDSWRA